MSLAPLILFVYNRPDHTAQCLEALAANPEAISTHLIIYADGAKEDAGKEELYKIEKVWNLVNQENRFKECQVMRAGKNKGLANSIIEGVTAVIAQYGKAIIVEDDLICAPHFLAFMNEALNRYEFNEEVACITGYIYPVKQPLPEMFFLKGADCWGWATWARGWNLFEKDGALLLEKLQQGGFENDFNFFGSYPYMQMLADQIKGKNNSWAIRWYAAAYLSNKLTLYPGTSLVKNIGFDGSGTHSGKQNILSSNFEKGTLQWKSLPIEENLEAKKIIAKYFKLRKKNPLFSLLKRKFGEAFRNHSK